MNAIITDVRHRTLLAITIMVATTMQVLDSTIANVALPHMQGSLAATQDQISWVLTSYVVAAAIFTPPTGFLAGRIGRKKLFMVSIVGFTIASMLCGISSTLAEMVIFRLVQGMFGAALVPLSQAILLDIYPREKHGAAMAMWGIGIMIGPILGPTLGGYLTEFMNWRWVFFINVPLGIVSFMGIAALMPDSGRDRERPFDILGFTALSIAIGALQLALDRGHGEDWLESTEIIIEVSVFVVALYLFIVRMLMARQPFIDRRIFADRNFVIGIMIMFVTGMLVLASMALMPPFLQNILGFPVVMTGLLMAPRGIGVMVSMALAGRLIGKVDERILLAFGLVQVAFSMWMMAQFDMNVGAGPIIVSGVLQGLGLGMIFIPLTTISYATLDQKLRTEAAGIFSLARNIGSSIGISIVFTVLARQVQVNHSEMVQHVNVYNPTFQPLFIFENLSGQSAGTAFALIEAEIIRQASTLAFLSDFLLMMVLTLAALPLVLLMRRPDKIVPPPDTAWE